MPSLSKKLGECRLCGQHGPLQLSHIIPACVYRWLKSTGGPIRLSTEPNRRVQDGLKEYWLCLQCEDRFGKREKLFADSIFHSQAPKPDSITYGPWLNYFATSLAWRTVEFAHGKNPDAQYTKEQEELTAQAREEWRRVLLGSARLSRKFPLHVVMFQAGIKSNATDLPSNWNRFQLRQITLDIVGSSKSLMTYTKLGPFTFFGMIQHRKRDWCGTRINLEGGKFPPRKVVLPASILPLFQEKADLSAQALLGVSERQSALIGQTMDRRLQNAETDPHIQALLADYEMFGPKIFNGR